MKIKNLLIRFLMNFVYKPIYLDTIKDADIIEAKKRQKNG